MITSRPSKTYLTGPQLRRRYGGKSHVWLWRMLRRNPVFRGLTASTEQLYFNLDERVDAYDAATREPFVARVKAGEASAEA